MVVIVASLLFSFICISDRGAKIFINTMDVTAHSSHYDRCHCLQPVRQWSDTQTDRHESCLVAYQRIPR